jgi:Conserved hypothetical protein (DUF2461)
MATTAAGASFDADTLRFLRDLAAHNERPWFEAAQASLRAARARAGAVVRRSDGARAPEDLAALRREQEAHRRLVDARVPRYALRARQDAVQKTNIGIQFRHERAKDVHAPGGEQLAKMPRAPGASASGSRARRLSWNSSAERSTPVSSAQRFQNAGVSSTRNVKISRRPNSIANANMILLWSLTSRNV